MTPIAEELEPWIAALETVIADWESSAQPEFSRATDAVSAVAASWSGSNVGYQAHCYFDSFAKPPAGRQFNTEWGLSGLGFTSSDGWKERSEDEVLEQLVRAGADLEFVRSRVAATNCLEAFREGKSTFLSVAALFEPDGFLSAIRSRVEELSPPTEADLLRVAMPTGPVMTRDPKVNARLEPAPHQRVAAELGSMEAALWACKELRTEIKSATRHLRLLDQRQARADRSAGSTVFIGHGGSPAWRELKDFIQDRLRLQCDEFNRVPVAGLSTVARLNQMLDDAAIAFLVMTAEDATSEGAARARQNVVHEVGLFSGRLGFEKAIVLLEDGCEEFSNIAGLGQIRFPPGNIAASFENVRSVLEREGLVSEPTRRSP